MLGVFYLDLVLLDRRAMVFVVATFCARVLWAGRVDGWAIIFAVANFCAFVFQVSGLGVISEGGTSACCGI